MPNQGPDVAPRPSVLVVEDDEDTRETMADLLRDEGFEVSTARDGVEALAHLDGASLPAAMVLDMRMPRMGGAEVLRHVRSIPRLSALKVCVLSGTVEDAATEQADLVIEKPLLVDRLVQVQRWLQECIDPLPAAPQSPE